MHTGNLPFKQCITCDKRATQKCRKNQMNIPRNGHSSMLKMTKTCLMVGQIERLSLSNQSEAFLWLLSWFIAFKLRQQQKFVNRKQCAKKLSSLQTQKMPICTVWTMLPEKRWCNLLCSREKDFPLKSWTIGFQWQKTCIQMGWQSKYYYERQDGKSA